jgi:hypothetical protein
MIWAQAAAGFIHAENGALMRGLLHDHNSSLQKMSSHAVRPSALPEGVEEGRRNFLQGGSPPNTSIA